MEMVLRREVRLPFKVRLTAEQWYDLLFFLEIAEEGGNPSKDIWAIDQDEEELYFMGQIYGEYDFLHEIAYFKKLDLWRKAIAIKD